MEDASTACLQPHETLKADRSLWTSLKFIGYQRIPADETGPAWCLELRNCGCGSTLAVEVDA